MAAGGSSSPFGRPPASGGSGLADRAMFSGVIPKGAMMPMAGGFSGRQPMVGGVGGKARRMKCMERKETNFQKKFSKDNRTLSNNKPETEKLSSFDKLMSLVKRNGLWPTSGLLKCNCSSCLTSFQRAKLFLDV